MLYMRCLFVDNGIDLCWSRGAFCPKTYFALLHPMSISMFILPSSEHRDATGILEVSDMVNRSLSLPGTISRSIFHVRFKQKSSARPFGEELTCCPLGHCSSNSSFFFSCVPLYLATSNVEEFSGDGLCTRFVYACSSGFFYFWNPPLAWSTYSSTPIISK